MQELKTEMRNDFIIAQIPVQVVLFLLWNMPMLNVSFLIGGLVSLANFELMINKSSKLVAKVTEESDASSFYSNYIFRYLMMAGVVFLAMSTPKLVKPALLIGLFSIQFILFGKGLFRGIFLRQEPKRG
ncbi:MAG: ATP synthase subunit I [Candidatus Cloacimonetes bacterium]|nr:ATP synthase subunit I [Candidatus Cloacimonadota bacterium]